MVARRRKLVLGGPAGRPQTRFAVSSVDESSRHSIPVGLELAAFGTQCMFCGDAGQLRPYGAITLLATLSDNQKVTSDQIARPHNEHFPNVDVDIDQGPLMQHHNSMCFATSSVLQLVLSRTRCTACVLTQQFCMDLPLAMVVRGPFTGGALGSYPPSSPALQVSTAASSAKILRAGNMSGCGMGWLLRQHIMDGWDSLVMDEDLRSKENVSRGEALLVVHFLEHARNAHSKPPKSVAIFTTHYAQMLWLLTACGVW